MIETPPPQQRIRVLLVEDDEDDFLITRDLLAHVKEVSFDLEWARSYTDGLRNLVTGEYDVVLLDYRLGERTGLDFLGRMPTTDRTPPVILLTGQDEQGTDMAAMRAGAADYLSKSGLNSTMLERSIRYAFERRRQEEELRETQIRFESLAENMSDGAVIIDGTNTIVYNNPATNRIFGYGPGELEGHSLSAVIPPALREAHAEGMSRYLATGSKRVAWTGVQLPGLHKTGAEISLEISFGEYTRRGVPFFTAVIRDISERVQAEAALQASEERLRRYNRALVELAQRRTRYRKHGEDLQEITTLAANTLEVAQVGIWTFDQSASTLFCSSLFTRDTGLHSSGAELRAAEYPSYFAALHEERVVDAHDAQSDPRTAELTGSYLVPMGITSILDVPIRLRGRALGVLCHEHIGPARHWNVEEQAFAASLADQIALSFEAAEREAAERAQKQARQELAAAEAHYRRLVTASPQAIYALDREGCFIELNPAGERLVGRAADALRGRHFAEVIAPDDLPTAAAAVDQVISRRAASVDVEIRIVRPSGEERQVSIVGTGIIEDGGVTGLHGIARDVTEERERDRRVHLLASALEGLQEQGVSIVDAEGRVVYWNRTHARLLGYAADGSSVAGPEAFMPDEASRQEMREIVAAVRDQGSWSGRVRRRRLSDGEILVLDKIVGKVEGEGRILFFMIIQDASEKIAREQHLRRVERLASVGTLLSGVAHELNNPLSAVMGFTQLLLLEPRSESERDDLRTIAREAERMAKIVSDLRLVARDTQEEIQGKRERVDLNDVVRHVLKTRAYSLKTRNIETQEDLAADLPDVLADRGQIEQVLLNLIVNAEQAMEPCRGERRLIVQTHVTGRTVSAHVVDSGPGITAEHQERIFDPFYTTKAPGEGTGLGLSLVHSIISEHAGEIRVDSEVGRGTRFRIDLPAAPPAAQEVAAQSAPSPVGRPLRVLVVDDEEAVRRVVVRYIERRGHRVDEAAEGGQALELLARAEATYDVIVSDLRMPGLDGEALLQRLRESGTGMDDRVVFLTGDTASVQAMRTLSEAQVPVLAKPSGISQIVGLVEQIGARNHSPT